jgi:enterochelin esterase-like enzyme/sugar lactone lactonase YvrE
MRDYILFVMLFAAGMTGAAAQQKSASVSESLPLTPDSQKQPAVPTGELLKFAFENSTVFPGTTRDVTVYIPAKYDGKTPACLYVNQDGVQWNAPTVLDNLIAKGELPTIIGIFVTPGKVRARTPTALDRFNRSLEYDGLGDAYVRMLCDELIPFIETKRAADGRPIRISRKASDRAIGGSSSGAVCAFTAAWERPDAFARVFSAIGTYVGLRGADVYPTLVRKTEPKPLRIFLQDGSNDLDIYGGDWWMANQMMQRALLFAGYEVRHAWGDGGHSGKHGTVLFPEAMRWLWQGWPAAPVAGAGSPQMKEVLVQGEAWRKIGEGLGNPAGFVVDGGNQIFVNDVADRKLYRLSVETKASRFQEENGGGTGLAVGPDRRLYACATGQEKIVAYESNGTMHTIADGLKATAVAVTANGVVYAAGPGGVWRIGALGEKADLGMGIKVPGALCVSPDQSLLYIADSASNWVYSAQIQPDGSTRHLQRYYWLHKPDTRENAGTTGLAVDEAGRLYAATAMGVQFCDQAGRVNGIIPLPGGVAAAGVALAVAGEPTLYAATADGTVWARKIKPLGKATFTGAIKPAGPKL